MTTRSVPVKGGELRLTPAGLALVRGEEETALDPERLRYVDRPIADLLEHDQARIELVAGRGEETRQLIGLARVAPLDAADRPLPEGRWVEQAGALEARFCAGWLAADEELLVWLPTAAEVEIPSPVFRQKRDLALVITTRRQSLVAISDVGDLVERPLPQEKIELSKQIGRDKARAGDEVFEVPLLLESHFDEVRLLPGLEPRDRRLEMARLTLRRAGSKLNKADAERCAGWIERADEAGDPLAALTKWALHDALPLAGAPSLDRVRRALKQLRHREASSSVLVKWHRGFGLSNDAGLELLAHLFEEAEPATTEWALELHAWLRERSLNPDGDPVEDAEVDIAWSEHLLVCERWDEAQVVLEARLGALPNEELADLLPPPDADLSAGGGGQQLRIRILELLSLARGHGEDDPRTLAELAMLSPLVEDRVRSFESAATGPARERAATVLAVLDKGGLAPLDGEVPDSPDEQLRPLPKKLLYEHVRHPVAREGHTLGRLQTFLATVKVPDHSALVSYCERLTAKSSTAAERALADASLVFGVPGVSGFVSRGDKAVGVRAYEGANPFLLIGGRHLEADSPFYLHPWELRFCIGAEVAHLRLKHARVTASDVWAGTLDKGKFGLSVLLSAVPIFKGIEIIDRIGDIIDRYNKTVIGRVTQGVDLAEKTMKRVRSDTAKKKKRRRGEQPIDAANRELIAAHRVMQLTADRAGLLLAGDLGAALRAMFLTVNDYQPELSVAVHHGLASTLGRRDDEGDIVYQDLAVRACSLVAFYLSEDYGRLRRALVDGR